MTYQKLVYVLKWNGFVSLGQKAWTNGIYDVKYRSNYYHLTSKDLDKKFTYSYELIDYLVSKKICEECPVSSRYSDSYFLLNGFTHSNGVWTRGNLIIKRRSKLSKEYLFENKYYTYALLKKKLKEYGIKEIDDVLITGRINDL